MFSLSSILITVLLAIVGFCAAKWLFKKDTECEDRRRAAGKMAAMLKAYGLVKIPDFLIDYSVGDYSGMAHSIKQLAELFLHGEAGVVAEFDGVFARVLEAKLKSEAGRTLLAAKLADAVKASDPSVVQDAPAASISA